MKKDNLNANKDVFISYARENIDEAKKIYAALKKSGINCWFDDQDIDPGVYWKSSIETAINECPFFLCVLSKKAQENRGYRHNEIKIALEVVKELPQEQVYIIPVRLEECKIRYKEFEDIHIVDLFPDWNEKIRKVIHTIKKYKNVNSTNIDIKTFVELTYKKYFIEIKKDAPIFLIYQKAGKVFDVINAENIKRGNWRRRDGFDHTVVYYMASWIKENIDNYDVRDLSKEEIAEQITNTLIAYNNAEYYNKKEEVYFNYLNPIRRESAKKFVLSQAAMVYDEIMDMNVKYGFWGDPILLDHQMTFFIAEWVKDKTDNISVNDLSPRELAKEIAIHIRNRQ